VARFGRSQPHQPLIFRGMAEPVVYDPLSALLPSWANRMKPMCYNTVTRLSRSRFVPVGVQLVDNVIPIFRRRNSPGAMQYRDRFRVAVQTQGVNVPIPIPRLKSRAFPNPFTRIVRSHVLALGPASFIPIKSPVRRHYLPSTTHIVRRVLPYQLFVPVRCARKAWVAPPYVRVRTRPYPIQPPCVFVTRNRVRPSQTYYANRQRTVPVSVIGPPIFVNRVRQRAIEVVYRKPQRSIPFNTPSAPFPVHAVQQFVPVAFYRRSMRFIPGARQDIVVPVVRKRTVVQQLHAVFRHTSVIAGPVTTVVAPFFLPRRPQVMQTYYPIKPRPKTISTQAIVVVNRHKLVPPSFLMKRVRSPFYVTINTVTVAPIFVRKQSRTTSYYPIHKKAAIIATQAVLVVNRKRLAPPVVWPRKARTPFYVNVNVAVPTPFPFFRHLPRGYVTQYPKRYPVAAVALPPPNVQNVIVTSKRTVR